MSYPQIRLGQISKPPPRYDVRMNNDIQVLMTKLNEVLAVPDWGGHTPENKVDETDPLVCLANWLQQEDLTDTSHFAYLTNNFDIKKPKTYEKAIASNQAEEWTEAMKQKMDWLIQHKTWDLIPIFDVKPGHCSLKGKWIYRIKRGVDDQITRFKARWVVKGYLQQVGIDFDQTFAAVVKPMVFQALFAIAAFHNLDIEQMDDKTAFLHGIIDQLLYVEISRGYKQQWKNQVCQLKKALYGLKQSPRLWYECLVEFLFTKLGLY